MKFTNRENSNGGFTLIEIVVVLTIISILSTIGIVNYRDVQVRAAAAAMSMDIHTLEEEVLQGVALNPSAMSAAPRDLPDALGITMPVAPDGLVFAMVKASATELRVIVIARTDFALKVVARLAEIRPTTATAAGRTVVETIDVRHLLVEEVTPPAPSGNSN